MKRSEYPRPQLKRELWMNLNGTWTFQYDDDNVGMEEKWYKDDKAFNQDINVPFVYQTELSGINSKEDHEIIWYKKQFNSPKEWIKKKTILHFGAVDFETKVFVNGYQIGEHIGGHTPFSFDISPYLVESEEQVITVRVYDPRYDETIPRGKQTWQEKAHSIWYTNTTGIWQTVWLENLSESYIKSIFMTPNIDKGDVTLNIEIENPKPNQEILYEISFNGELVASGDWDVYSPFNELAIQLVQQNIYRTSFHNFGWTWTPETPNLFIIKLFLIENKDIVDEIKSYFGMRKVHTENGMVYLNNKPYYQKLVLDQGYWPESLMTAPSDEALKLDIELAKKMGFNGCRKHQKVEDPRFLYWADKLGFLVWGESPSAHYFSEKSVNLVTNEWKEIIARDYNHPSIVTWVPFNESWGIGDVARNEQQQNFELALYYLIQSLDTTRLVVSNDGWEMTKTDIIAVHNYQHGQENEPEKFADFKEDLLTKEGVLKSKSAGRDIFVHGYSYQGEPILLTEFGGIGFRVSEQGGWGYTTVSSAEDLLKEYKRVLEVVYASEIIYGFCYTQLYDVEQEINGLLTYNREPKSSLEKIKEINSMYNSKTR